MTMWKTENHFVQGKIETTRVVLGSVTCMRTKETYFNFMQHHGAFAEFEVVCPGCKIPETFGPKDVLREDED
ncbi:hypothetical protein [Acidovorax sp. Root219]|uniref:hypothetical protein n=1 Tax=Acidovorax sp. Root219 TaxID=1736493 RepID=UPI000709C958|nr:hypothetical protein [Acidovorax sp. Root219]KRC36219.1 hypothetical protein ASE28_01410 [Acidovorax sp. Root219]